MRNKFLDKANKFQEKFQKKLLICRVGKQLNMSIYN